MSDNRWRRRAFTFLEAVSENLPDDGPGLAPDEAAALVAPMMRSAGWRGPIVDLRRWFANPAKYTPFLDEVALSRAVDFDWPVIRRLSADERVELRARLAARDDPFDVESERDWLAFLRRHAYTRWAAGERQETPRHRAWMRGGRIERQTLADGVSRARRMAVAA